MIVSKSGSWKVFRLEKNMVSFYEDQVYVHLLTHPGLGLWAIAFNVFEVKKNLMLKADWKGFKLKQLTECSWLHLGSIKVGTALTRSNTSISKENS